LTLGAVMQLLCQTSLFLPILLAMLSNILVWQRILACLRAHVCVCVCVHLSASVYACVVLTSPFGYTVLQYCYFTVPLVISHAHGMIADLFC